MSHNRNYDGLFNVQKLIVRSHIKGNASHKIISDGKSVYAASDQCTDKLRS